MKFVISNAKAFQGDSIPVIPDEKIKTDRIASDSDGKNILCVKFPSKKEITLHDFHLNTRKIIRLARQHGFKKISVNIKDFHFPKLKLRLQDMAEILGINFEMANFEFVERKTEPKEGWEFVEEVHFLFANTATIKKSLERGQTIGKEVNSSRSLANTPGGEMTPALLAKAAEKTAENTKIRVTVLEKEDMKKLKMGGVLGVAQGSDEKPKFIIMEYKGASKEKPIVLVGKGVTFDTGGLNIKPGQSMNEMNMDMSGGAAVIHTISAAAALKLKKNIVGLIPAVENMPSGSSYRPGDILTSMSGKTIEVLNTDAEGRIILADALTFAKKYDPRLVIDIATLTGASLVALGQRASAIFTKNERARKLAESFGELMDDRVWALPLWDEFEEEIKGTFGDIANIGKTRYGGTITAAIFLYQFAKDFPWMHIDIAPRMTAMETEQLAKGSVGSPVRLLVKFLEKF